MPPSLDLDQRAAALRKAFDRAFGEPPQAAPAGTEDLLAIALAGDPHALQLSELSGLVFARKIVPVPTQRTELVGLAGIRGKLVPVFDLRALLGYPAGAAPTPWLAICSTSSPIALAFEVLEGFLRVPRADLYSADDVETRGRHVAHVIRIGDVTRRVVDARSIITALEGNAGASGSTKER